MASFLSNEETLKRKLFSFKRLQNISFEISCRFTRNYRTLALENGDAV